MAYAAVVTVKLEGDPARGQQMLRDVLIPRLKAQAGFHSARFLRSQDGGTGIGTAIFHTEADAKAGLDAMQNNRPADAPAVVSAAVYEVIMEA